MIFGLEHLLAAGMLTTLVNAPTCPPPPVPPVQIVTRNGSPKYYYHVPSAQLGSFQIDTTFQPSPNTSYVVGGVTHGKVLISRQMQIQTLSNSHADQHCMSIAQVVVTLDYQPDVYIASEYQSGTCRFNTTMQHEVQHVNLDIITLNEFIPRFQAYIQNALATLPPMQAMPKQMMPQVQEFIGMRVEAAAQQALAEMDQVRRGRHQRIDNAQEYDRLSQACAHEPNPIAMPGQQYRRR